MTKRDTQRVIRQFQTSGIDLKDEYATRWLANHISKIKTTMRQESFIESSETTINKSALPGRMCFFGYSPKTKNDLLFWDEFPIVIILHKQAGGFLGLNLHYLSPPIRAQFLNRILMFVDDRNNLTKKNKTTRIKVSYGILKNTESLDPFRHCIKKYYYSHIRTKVALIPPNEWKMVPFFPLDRFKGMSREKIWRLAL